MEAVELLNTLAVTLVGSEYLLRSKGLDLQRNDDNAGWVGVTRCRLAAAAALGLLNVAALFVTGYQKSTDNQEGRGPGVGSSVVQGMHSVSKLPWHSVSVLGAEILFAFLISLLWSLLALSFIESRGYLHRNNDSWKTLLGISSCLVFTLSFAFAWYGDFGEHAPWLAKAVLAMLGYSGMFLLDVRRYCPHMSILDLALAVSKALLLTLPIVPFVAVGISFALLVLVSAVESAKLDPSFLNWPVYYLTLYGPFAAVYYQSKKLCLDNAGSYLPRRHSSGRDSLKW